VRTRSRCNRSVALTLAKGVFFSAADSPSSPSAVASARACLWLCLDQCPAPQSIATMPNRIFLYVFSQVSLLQVAEAHASVDAVCLGGAVEPPASSCRRSAFSHDCIVRSRNLQLPALFLADGAFCCRYPTADQQRADADAEAVVQHMMDRSLPNTCR
jgi:hypothetical protein